MSWAKASKALEAKAKEMGVDIYADSSFDAPPSSVIMVVCAKCKTKQELGGGLHAKDGGEHHTHQVCVVCKTKQWCKWDSPND